MAIQQTVHVGDALLKELKKRWLAEESPISAIIDHLRQKFGITQQTAWERLLLYGRIDDNEMVEQIVGWLIAIAPGIVILDATSSDLLRPLSGIVERYASPHIQLFGVRTFSAESGFIPFLDILTSPFIQVCPVWIHWQIGSGEGENHGTWGIDPDRWHLLDQWLTKWLPE